MLVLVLVGAACGQAKPPAEAVANGAKYQRADQSTFTTDGVCASFEPPFFAAYFGPPNPIYNHIDAGSISIIWGNDYSGISSASDVATLTQLKTDPVLRQNVVNRLLAMRQLIVDQYKITSSPAKSRVDGKCYRTSIYIRGTGLFAGDTIEGGGGGTRCDEASPNMQIPHPNLVWLSAALQPTVPPAPAPWMLAHEYMHTLQCGVSKGGDQTGWSWVTESYANYLGNLLQNTTAALGQFQETTFWSLDLYLHPYAEWPFWLYLEKQFGAVYTSDVVQRNSYPTESAFEFLRRTLPFNCADADLACRNSELGNLFGRFANSTVNYSFYSNLQSIDYRANAIFGAGVARASAHMEKVGSNRFRIAEWLAPQRYAFNKIQLIPDSANRILSIGLEGWAVPVRGAAWRATVVATLDDTSAPPVEAYGSMFSSGTQTIDLNQWESQLGTSIKKLYLVVAAVPGNWKKDSELSGFADPVRYRELDRYVYDLTLSGAWPLGHEPQSLRTPPNVAGAAHANGGGFVASTATVAATAYVGPEARVLDNAQVLGNARIEGRATVAGSAVVQDNAIVSSTASIYENSTIKGYATIRDNARIAQNASVVGDGKIQGDTGAWGSMLVSASAVSLGAPLIEGSNGITLTGTAISDGARYFASGTASQGTPYNNWAVSDGGLLLGYDFSVLHPYRIKDIHVDSDAYYLGANGLIGGTPNIQVDTTLASNVLILDGSGYIQMPKWSLDQRSYRLQMLLKWAGGTQTQYLLDATTGRSEELALQIIPVAGSSGFDVKLLFKDRLGVSREVLLQNVILQSGQWLNLEMNYDFASASMILKASPAGSATTVQASIAMPYPTRELDYDTLDIRLGANQTGTQLLTGSVDDIKIYRY